MFDFGVGYSELFVLALIAVIVIGPKDLPKVLRTIGRMTTKARGLAREFQGHVDQAMREAGIDELKKEVQSISGKDAGLKAAAPLKPDTKQRQDDFKELFGDAVPAAEKSDKDAAAPT